jgi:hypothetical protein
VAEESFTVAVGNKCKINVMNPRRGRNARNNLYKNCHFIGADSMEFNPLDITSIPLNVTALPNILRYTES